MWASFIAVLGFLITVLGIVGIGAALDVSVPERWKRRVRTWADRQSENLSAAQFDGRKIFDKIFGTRVISSRAMLASAGLSLGSVSIGFLVAYVTSDSQIQHSLFPLLEVRSIFGIASVAIFIAALLISDFISYAQTRIFVLAINEVRNIYFAIILYVSDIILSLGIFSIFYSFAKAITTVIAISTVYQDKIDVVIRVSPEIVLSSVNVWGGGLGSQRIKAISESLALYRADPNAKHVSMLGQAILNLQYANPEELVASAGPTHVYCLNDLSIASEGRTHVYELLRDSEDLANKAMGLENSRATFGGKASFSRSLPADNLTSSCALHVVERRVRLSTSMGLRSVTWGDFILGSFAATMHGLETSVETKFSALIYDDPVAGVPMITTYAMTARNSKFLGIGQNRKYSSVDLYTPPGNRDHFYIPFSIFAFSSLSANVIFLFYLISAIATGVGSLILRPSRGYIKDRAIFVRLGLSIAIFLIFGIALMMVIGLGFNAILWMLLQKPSA